MDAIERRAEIKRAGAERVVRTARHKGRQSWLPPPHLLRRRPAWPFPLCRYPRNASPGEPIAPDANAVAERLPVGSDQIEAPLLCVDNDGAGLVVARIAHRRPRHG